LFKLLGFKYRLVSLSFCLSFFLTSLCDTEH
jgi:hypothetical protein